MAVVAVLIVPCKSPIKVVAATVAAPDMLLLPIATLPLIVPPARASFSASSSAMAASTLVAIILPPAVEVTSTAVWSSVEAAQKSAPLPSVVNTSPLDPSVLGIVIAPTVIVPLVFTLVTLVLPNCMVLLASTVAPLPSATEFVMAPLVAFAS